MRVNFITKISFHVSFPTTTETTVVESFTFFKAIFPLLYLPRRDFPTPSSSLFFLEQNTSSM